MHPSRKHSNAPGPYLTGRIDYHRSFVAVQMEKETRPLRMRFIIWEGSEGTARITTRRLQFDHICPLACQEQRGIGTRHIAGEVNHAYALESSAHIVSFLYCVHRSVLRTPVSTAYGGLHCTSITCR